MGDTDIGVLVGRFQTPELHDAHKDLIGLVLSKHKKVTIFLGVARALVTQRNPLGFTERRLMIREEFPDIDVQPIADCPTNEQWARDLEEKIKDTYPTGSVTLYGGRDSFIDPYKLGGGRFACEMLETKHFVAATDKRRECSREVKASKDFRHGVIYAAYNQFPKVFPTVDVAIVNLFGKNEDHEVLLGKKPNESAWRFIGGFVDPTDKDFASAAKRECNEETGLSIGEPDYVGNYKIDDWRYRSELDKIITTFFAAYYVSGSPRPSDDISELKWFKIKDLGHVDIVSAHAVLQTALTDYLRRKGYVSTKLPVPDGQLQSGTLATVSAGNY